MRKEVKNFDKATDALLDDIVNDVKFPNKETTKTPDKAQNFNTIFNKFLFGKTSYVLDRYQGIYIIGLSGSGKSTIVKHYHKENSATDVNVPQNLRVYSLDLDILGYRNRDDHWLIDPCIADFVSYITAEYPVIVAGISRNLTELIDTFLNYNFRVLALPLLDFIQYKDRIQNDKLRPDRLERSDSEHEIHLRWYEDIVNSYQEIELLPNNFDLSIKAVDAVLNLQEASDETN